MRRGLLFGDRSLSRQQRKGDMSQGVLSSRKHAERGSLCQVPNEVGGSRTKDAKMPGVSRRALYLKMADYKVV